MTQFFKRWLLSIPCVLALGACATPSPSQVDASEASVVVPGYKPYPACWNSLNRMVSLDEQEPPSYQQPLAVVGNPGESWTNVLARDPFLANLVHGNYVSVKAGDKPGTWWLSTAPKGRNVLGFWNPSHGFCIGTVELIRIETYTSGSSTVQLPVTGIKLAPGVDANDFLDMTGV